MVVNLNMNVDEFSNVLVKLSIALLEHDLTETWLVLILSKYLLDTGKNIEESALVIILWENAPHRRQRNQYAPHK